MKIPSSTATGTVRQKLAKAQHAGKVLGFYEVAGLYSRVNAARLALTQHTRPLTEADAHNALYHAKDQAKLALPNYRSTAPTKHARTQPAARKTPHAAPSGEPKPTISQVDESLRELRAAAWKDGIGGTVAIKLKSQGARVLGEFPSAYSGGAVDAGMHVYKILVVAALRCLQATFEQTVPSIWEHTPVRTEYDAEQGAALAWDILYKEVLKDAAKGDATAALRSHLASLDLDEYCASLGLKAPSSELARAKALDDLELSRAKALEEVLELSDGGEAFMDMVCRAVLADTITFCSASQDAAQYRKNAAKISEQMGADVAGMSQRAGDTWGNIGLKEALEALDSPGFNNGPHNRLAEHVAKVTVELKARHQKWIADHPQSDSYSVPKRRQFYFDVFGPMLGATPEATAYRAHLVNLLGDVYREVHMMHVEQELVATCAGDLTIPYGDGSAVGCLKSVRQLGIRLATTWDERLVMRPARELWNASAERREDSQQVDSFGVIGASRLELTGDWLMPEVSDDDGGVEIVVPISFQAPPTSIAPGRKSAAPVVSKFGDRECTLRLHLGAASVALICQENERLRVTCAGKPQSFAVTVEELLPDGCYRARVDNSAVRVTIDPRRDTATPLPEPDFEVAGDSRPRLLAVTPDGLKLLTAPTDEDIAKGVRSEAWLCVEEDGKRRMVDFDLNDVNCCVCEALVHPKLGWRRAVQNGWQIPTVAHFHAVYVSYCKHVATINRIVDDAITGKRLSIADQTLNLNIDAGVGATGLKMHGVQREEWVRLQSVADMVPLLLSSSAWRTHGVHSVQPVLLRAGPGTGKTWSAQQLIYELASRAPDRPKGLNLVPIIVYVQKLARLIRQQAEMWRTFDGDLLAFYIACEFPEDDDETAPFNHLLMHAYRLTALVVILDGIDEAATLKGVIEDFLIEKLARRHTRCVATSRPEGVTLEKYTSDFVIMNLAPLTDEQQEACMSMQMQDSEFSVHLMSTCYIRRDHDELFNRSFPRQQDRDQIESLACDDLFRSATGGGFDGSMRQHTLDGSRIIGKATLPPQSSYLRMVNERFVESGVLAVLDSCSKGDAAHDAIASMPMAPDPPETSQAAMFTEARVRKLATKLALLWKRQKGGSASSLWESIMINTDEVMTVAETMQPVFAQALRVVMKNAGIAESALSFGDIKDPIRVFEKARDDYATRFKDSKLAEACVTDVLRARLVIDTPEKFLQVALQLSRRLTVPNVTPPVELRPCRLKNKFTEPDPTHFRNLLFNFQLEQNGATVFAEVQLHLRGILHLNEERHAHAHYDYFRSLYAGSYTTELDVNLERMFDFLQGIQRTPVLLSLLVIVLSDPNKRRAEDMPRSRFDLYTMAFKTAISRAPEINAGTGKATKNRCSMQSTRNVSTMLRHVGAHNHMHSLREFQSKDVIGSVSGLPDSEHLLNIWFGLQNASALPLVKVLMEGGRERSLYQFKHISFQEAYFVQSLVEGELSLKTVVQASSAISGDLEHQLLGEVYWRGNEEGAELARFISIFAIPFYLNSARMGGSALGERLSKTFNARFVLPDGSNEVLHGSLQSAMFWEAFALLKPACWVTTWIMNGVNFALLPRSETVNAFDTLCDIIRTAEKLQTLSLRDDGIQGRMWSQLAAALKENRTLINVFLSPTGFDAASPSDVGKALACIPTLSKVVMGKGPGQKGHLILEEVSRSLIEARAKTLPAVKVT